MAKNPIAVRAGDASDRPADDYEKVTKANADLVNGPFRALLVGTPGTANLMTLAGDIRENVPLQPGYNPLVGRQVRLGGTADNIWALR